MNTRAEQEEIILALRRVGAEINRCRASPGHREIGLVDVTGAKLGAQVEAVKERVLLAEPVVEKPGALRWGSGWGGNRSCAGCLCQSGGARQGKQGNSRKGIRFRFRPHVDWVVRMMLGAEPKAL